MASKFSRDKIAGLSVGAGLLNQQSQNAEIQKRTEYIQYDRIHPNPRNEMSMTGLETLANQIKNSGLEQPLVVYQQEDGEYMLLTGERRYRAIGMLIENGEWAKDKPVECKVKDLDKMSLPLDFEGKEMLSILVTNQNRTKTDADKAFEIENWTKLISELRKKGVEYLVSGYDESGNFIQTGKISGESTKDIIAEQMGISSGQVAKFNKVSAHGTDELKNALKENRININNAAKVASMEKEDQDEFIAAALESKEEGEQITSDDVAKAVYEQKPVKKLPKKEKDKEQLPEGYIDVKTFKKDLKDIQIMLNAIQGVQLTDSQYSEYCRYITGLKKLFRV